MLLNYGWYQSLGLNYADIQKESISIRTLFEPSTNLKLTKPKPLPNSYSGVYELQGSCESRS